MSNYKSQLAYARKHRNEKLIADILERQTKTRHSGQARIRSAQAFRDSIKTARQAGNRELENRIRMQYAEINGMKIS